jgi:membrane protein implicated in regulation of membrane protease activity
MWVFWLLVGAAILAIPAFFAFPGAVPIAIVVFAVCLISAPFALRAARSAARRPDERVSRNARGEVTDLGYLDSERKVPRTQRAVFFGTPQWERYKREKAL